MNKIPAEKTFDKISSLIPEEIGSDLINLICWYEDQRYENKVNKTLQKIPPSWLRFKVTSRPFLETFIRTGKISSSDIEHALKKSNLSCNSFQNILEFGCGCGRITIWLKKYFKKNNFYGTDIDKEAISWCKKNLNFGKFTTNNPLPPLKYSSNMFDLVYSYSIFTHLNEKQQFLWLRELKRITKPGGIVLITLRGDNDYEKRNWSKKDHSELKRKGFLYRHSNLWKGIFPDAYQNAFHTKDYVFENFSKYFDVLNYVPKKHKTTGQDVVVLKKNNNFLIP